MINLNILKPRKQFCKYDHDTFVCGRTKKRVCNLCYSKYRSERYTTNRNGAKDCLQKAAKLHYTTNKVRLVAEGVIRKKERMQIDPFYKLTEHLRTRLTHALKAKSWQKDTHF